MGLRLLGYLIRLPKALSGGVLLAALALAVPAVAESGEKPADHPAEWPAHPTDLELLLAYHDLEVLRAKGGLGGVMGVKKVTFLLADGREVSVKWKEAPAGDADGWNNSPRKEMAAYAIQRWFLDPEDYVVPTTVVRCLSFEQHEVINPGGASATIPETECVVGAISAWLNDVTVPDDLHEADRFESDRVYARHLANFNLLGYLIRHEDGRDGNILVAKNDSERRVFAVDNGVAFGGLVKNYWVPNWHKIRVAALSKQSIDRLRQIGDEQIQALAILSEHQVGSDGVLRPVPPSENPNPARGARSKPGWLQLGLSQKEIDRVEQRLEALLEAVDSGAQPVF